MNSKTLTNVNSFIKTKKYENNISSYLKKVFENKINKYKKSYKSKNDKNKTQLHNQYIDVINMMDMLKLLLNNGPFDEYYQFANKSYKNLKSYYKLRNTQTQEREADK